MKNLIKFMFVFIILNASLKSLIAQNENRIIQLSLQNAVDLAVHQSSSVMYTQNQNVNYYWRWENYKTSFRPQLTFSGELPNYAHSSTPVTQPDGSVEFKQVSNFLSTASLSLSQPIPQLGTSVYAATSVYRAQDFNQNNVEFSGTPFSIGFVQPLFAYNYMKWQRKTEPLVYEEAQKNFVESIEKISYNTTRKFFVYLKVQTNYNLAENNLKNSDNNLKIADTKKTLGKISENDYNRIQLSVYNAQKALNKARMDLKNADFELKSYIGLDQEKEIELTIPLNTLFFDIDPQKAVEEAKDNRKETPQFERRLIQAERDLVQAKRSNGLRVTLKGSYGISNNAPELPGIYENVQTQRLLSLSLSIPVLDWGKSESKVKLAESQNQLVKYDVEKEKQDFEREVIVQVEQFNLLKDWIMTAREADKVAGNGYQIALKKFQNGEISITDFNIALQERESAKRDYIGSLESYWEAFYNLRILTLYDFQKDKKIWYYNPMLSGEDTVQEMVNAGNREVDGN